jgi:hypothetical protein
VSFFCFLVFFSFLFLNFSLSGESRLQIRSASTTLVLHKVVAVGTEIKTKCYK